MGVQSMPLRDTTQLNQQILDAFHLQQANQLDSAFQIAQDILHASEALSYKKGIAAACMRLGSLYNLKSKNDTALFLMRKCYRLRRELKDYGGATGACFQLSYIFKEQGKLDSAYYVLFEALRMTQLDADSAATAYTLNELGYLSMDYGEVDTARYFFEQSLRLAEYMQDDYLAYKAQTGLGQYHLQKEHDDQAVHHLQLADSLIHLPSFEQDENARAQSANNLAVCYDRLKQYPQAKSFYRKALSVYRQNENRLEEANTLSNLGLLFYNMEALDSSIYYLRQAAQLADTLKLLMLQTQTALNLADAYGVNGKFETALRYYRQYKALSDSLLNSEKVNSISEMQALYDTEQKEQRIRLLAEQNKTRVAERNFFIAGSILLLLGITTLLIYYRQRRKLARKNAEIANQKIEKLLNEQEIESYNAMLAGQEEERQRIATDLHDRLGSMLSTVKLLTNSLNSKAEPAKHQKLEALVDDACVEVRRVSHNLSTGMVRSFGLKKTLEDLCSSINESQLIECKLLVYGLDERLEINTEIGLYRMIQEILNNTLKHAKAKKVLIQINRTENELNLTVEDDGVGFNPSKQAKGIGLSNLNARAQQLNGNFHIDSTPGRGTISIIDLPLNQDEL
jgi:signal transduction histidine kinase